VGTSLLLISSKGGRKAVRGILGHQEYPFQCVVEGLQPIRRAGFTPFVDIVVNYHSSSRADRRFAVAAGEIQDVTFHVGDGWECEIIASSQTRYIPVRLLISVIDSGAELWVRLDRTRVAEWQDRAPSRRFYPWARLD
jgi:hypothetical protein